MNQGEPRVGPHLRPRVSTTGPFGRAQGKYLQVLGGQLGREPNGAPLLKTQEHSGCFERWCSFCFVFLGPRRCTSAPTLHPTAHRPIRSREPAQPAISSFAGLISELFGWLLPKLQVTLRRMKCPNGSAVGWLQPQRSVKQTRSSVSSSVVVLSIADTEVHRTLSSNSGNTPVAHHSQCTQVCAIERIFRFANTRTCKAQIAEEA